MPSPRVCSLNRCGLRKSRTAKNAPQCRSINTPSPSTTEPPSFKHKRNGPLAHPNKSQKTKITRNNLSKKSQKQKMTKKNDLENKSQQKNTKAQITQKHENNKKHKKNPRGPLPLLGQPTVQSTDRPTDRPTNESCRHKHLSNGNKVSFRLGTSRLSDACPSGS